MQASNNANDSSEYQMLISSGRIDSRRNIRIKEKKSRLFKGKVNRKINSGKARGYTIEGRKVRPKRLECLNNKSLFATKLLRSALVDFLVYFGKKLTRSLPR